MRFLFLVTILSLFAAVGHAKEIEIGLASNFSEVSTGSFNPYGGYFKDGATLALRDSESRLREKGITIKFVPFDYGTSDVKVLQAAKSAVASNVLAVLGYNYSSNALLAAPIHQKGHLMMLSPSASANRLGTMGRYVHMGSFDNAFMGESLARIAKEQFKAKRAALVPAGNCAYCADLADSFESSFKKRGGEVVFRASVLSEDKDFNEVIAKLKGTNFDVILVPNQELTSARMISAISKAGIQKPFLGADGWGNVGQEFFGVLGGVDFTGYSVSHWHPELKSPASVSFVDRYQKAFGKIPNDNSVLAYDSMLLLIEAVLKAKEHTREGLEDSFLAIRHFRGITGDSDLAPGRAPRKSLVLLKANSKKFEVVKAIAPSKSGGAK